MGVGITLTKTASEGTRNQAVHIERPVTGSRNFASRPKPISGEYWERPLPANAEQREAAVCNAQTIFAPGASGSQCAAVSGCVLLIFGTWPRSVSPTNSTNLVGRLTIDTRRWHTGTGLYLQNLSPTVAVRCAAPCPEARLRDQRNQGTREWFAFLPYSLGHIENYPILHVYDHDTGVLCCVAHLLLSAAPVFRPGKNVG